MKPMQRRAARRASLARRAHVEPQRASKTKEASTKAGDWSTTTASPLVYRWQMRYVASTVLPAGGQRSQGMRRA